MPGKNTQWPLSHPSLLSVRGSTWTVGSLECGKYMIFQSIPWMFYNYNPFISLYYWPEIVCTVLLYFGVGGCHLPSSWCQIIMSKNVKNHSQQKVEVKVESTCRMIHAGWTSVTKDQEYKSFLDVGIDELSCKIRFHKAVPLKQTKTIINKDSRNIHAILQKAATFF